MKSGVPAQELHRWIAQFEEELHEPTPERWYMARIAYEVYLLRHTVSFMFDAKRPAPELTVKDFLLKFMSPDEIEALPEDVGETQRIRYEGRPTQVDADVLKLDLIKTRSDLSRISWMAAAGMFTGGKGKLPPLPPEVVKKSRGTTK